MPAGGLAELKRRKRETEGEASGAAGQEDSVCPASSSSSEPVIEQKPGELQHVSLPLDAVDMVSPLMSKGTADDLGGG